MFLSLKQAYKAMLKEILTILAKLPCVEPGSFCVIGRAYI
jgi:hypothetical protein